MKSLKIFKSLFWIFSGAVVLTWVSCFFPHFESIDQPESANLNSPFEVDISVARHGNNATGQVLTRIGLQLPAGLLDSAVGREVTPYRLIFGASIPLGWTVEDSILFTGVDTGIFIHSGFLSGEMTFQNPPSPGYYWWVSETIEYMETASGQIFFTPVITTGNLRGNFYLAYSVGHWQDSSLDLINSSSSGHLITCGLEDTVYVTSTANDGPGSLRVAIDSVSSYGTILFDLPLPDTINLSWEIQLYKNVTIHGPEIRDLVISGDGICRVFNILSNKEVHLSGFQIINGSGSTGGGILCSTNSRGSLTNLLVRNNTAEYGGGIYFQQSENTWTLSDVTVCNNLATSYGGGICNGGIFGDGYAALSFDSVQRCNIYSNVALLGSEIYLKDGCNSVIYLNTFTVIQPNDYWAWPQEKYQGFDILNFVVPLLDQDVYVSPGGSNSNTGTSPQSPFKNISHALKMTYADPQDPNVIHLAAGIYSEATNSETFPLYANSHIKISGQGRGSSIIEGYKLLICNKDHDLSIDNIGMTIFSNMELTESNLSLTNFRLFHEANIYCDNSTLNMDEGIIDSLYYSYASNSVIDAYSASTIELSDLWVHDNSLTLLKLSGSYASLSHCLIEDNECPVGDIANQLIELRDSSRIELSHSTIKNNVSFRALTFSGNSSAWFDPVNRCNIFNNSGVCGRDLNAENYDGPDTIQVVLDTFSVMYPTEYYAYPLNTFSFDNWHGNLVQVSQNLYVSIQGSDENSGLTPEDPFRTITKACLVYYPIDNTHDTIFLAEGVYRDGEVYPVFPSRGMTIAGAGINSTGIFDGTVEINGRSQVTLKGLRICNNGGDGLHVIGSEVLLDHCLVDNNDYAVSVEGSSIVSSDSTLVCNNKYGIYINNASVVLENLFINQNSRIGINIKNSDLTGYNLVVSGNGNSSSSYTCGGVRADNSRFNILNSVFEDNQSLNTGGAIRLNNSGGLIINNLFRNNMAQTYGGALSCEGAMENQPVTLVNNLFINNTGRDGGAIFYVAGENNPDQSLTLCGTQLLKNNAAGNGGGLYVAGGALNILDCRIEENHATHGGGIYFGQDPLQEHYFSHSLISRNLASKGGGIYFDGMVDINLSWDELNRCSIFLNRADDSGHDLFASNSTKVYSIVVDTFTLMNPDDRFAWLVRNYDFDILHGIGEAGDNDYYVSPDGDDRNSGLSFDDPLKTISDAVLRTILDTVWPHNIYLAEGVYSASLTGERFPLDLCEPVEISGMGAGQTRIDGEHLFPLFVKSDRDTDVLRNLSLMAGSSSGSHGGAVMTEGTGTLELENMVLDTNYAYSGGAIYSDSTFLEFTDVVFSRNNAHYGAAIYSSDADHRFRDIAFSGNVSPYGSGGGIYAKNCQADWNEVIFTGNSANNGGGLYISNNFRNQGHGIYFIDNQASSSGGAIYISNAIGVANNMTLIQNRAKNGGAIRVHGSEFSLFNLGLQENESVQNGSALYIHNSYIDIDLLTVAGNLNPADYTWYIYSSSSILDLTNSIFWGNGTNIMRILNSTMYVAHCDLQGGQDGISISDTLNWLEGNIDADPLFEGSGDYPYQLSAGSPCIDAGTPDTTGLNLPLWDLAGNYRLWDGDSDGDTIVDMGAYEAGSVGVGVPGSGFRVPGSDFQVEVWPNPAAEAVVVSVTGQRSAVGGNVTLKIYDLYGREVRTLMDEVKSPGEYTVRLDVSDLPAGMYLVMVQACGESAARKLVVR